MSDIRVITTENAGAVLYLGGLVIWADVLNEENPDGYEVLSEAHFERLLTDPAFRPDLLLFTHRHPDHFSQKRIERTLEVFPEVRVFIGGDSKDTPSTFEAGTLRISIIPLPHEGKAYEDVENDAFLLEAPEGTVLLAGDCPVACPELLEAMKKWSSRRPSGPDRKLDLALLNFPWLSLGKGRKALFSMDPGRVLFFHLPAPENDTFGYRHQAERMLSEYRKDRDWQISGSPFQVISCPEGGDCAVR